MEKVELLYEGKAKKVYTTREQELLIVSYKDDATAYNGQKKGTIEKKGIVNNIVSNHMMKKLEKIGIKTHFVETINDRETIVKKVEIIPLEVIVRNIAAGSLSKRLGVDEGTPMKETIIEFCYKNDDLGDPMINNYHIKALEIATDEEIKTIEKMALQINEYMLAYFYEVGISLIDFKIEFGKTSSGEIILADEISPDTCRFWDIKTKEKLDKDRFRRGLGDEDKAYQEVMKRLVGEA